MENIYKEIIQNGMTHNDDVIISDSFQQKKLKEREKNYINQQQPIRTTVIIRAVMKQSKKT